MPITGTYTPVASVTEHTKLDLDCKTTNAYSAKNVKRFSHQLNGLTAMCVKYKTL